MDIDVGKSHFLEQSDADRLASLKHIQVHVLELEFRFVEFKKGVKLIN